MSDTNQGEGNQEADRKYREGVEKTLSENDVEKLAREASPDDEQEARELAKAERIGRGRAKEEDPKVNSDN